MARPLTVALALWLAVAAASADEQTVLHEIAEQADLVVLGRGESAESHWDESGRLIVTDTRVRIEQSLKGNPPATVIVRTLGGVAGGAGMGASHAVSLAAGERAGLFLRRSRFGPYYVIAGGARGKLALAGARGDVLEKLSRSISPAGGSR